MSVTEQDMKVAREAHSLGTVAAIAVAIEAERERCAKIADEWKEPFDGALRGGNLFARLVAAAIRTPSTGEEAK